MRLSCHLIADGKFFPAGVEIPEGVIVPGGAMQFVIEQGANLPLAQMNVELAKELTSTPEAASHPYHISS